MDFELQERQVDGNEVGSSAKALVEALTKKFPYLDFEKNQISLAVNKEYITDDIELQDGDEVALLPPIAGG